MTDTINVPRELLEHIAGSLDKIALQSAFSVSEEIRALLATAPKIVADGGTLIDSEKEFLRRLAAVQKAEPQPVSDAYRIAVDTGLVCAHIGITNPEDDYETAIKKLNDLICWSIQVDRDLDREHVKGLMEALEQIADTDPDDGTAWFHDVANKALATYKAQEGK